MTYPVWKAKDIAKAIPADWLDALRRMDGATFEKPVYARDSQAPTILFHLGFCTGLPGSSMSGFDSVEWLTDMGQAVVDAARPDEEDRG
jgi:hypothetical protein